MVDLLPWFNETKQAFENGDRFSLLIEYCVLIVSLALTRKDIRLPKHRIKYSILSLLGFFTIALWSSGLLDGLMLYFLIVLLLSLAAVFYYSSRGNLLWPCSLIDRKVSNFLMANEPEKAEQMLYHYRWCFLDSTGKYSYNIRKANIAAAKGDMSSSIEILSKIDKKTLNKDETIRLELRKADYFLRLGDFKRAKNIMESLPEYLDKYLIQVYLIQALSAEVEGDLKKSSDLLLDAISTCSNCTDVYYQVAMNNIGRIRRLEGNYTDSFYYYQKQLKLVNNSKNKESIHIAYQNAIDSLILDHKLEDGNKLIQEYYSIIDISNSNDLLEYYNFLIRYYRQVDNRDKLFETLEESRKIMYPIMSRKEQLRYDISQLRERWDSKLLSPAFLDQIECQYTEYSDFPSVEKFNCYIEIHHVLQDLSEIGFLGTHVNLYNTNKENIRIVIPGLENYLSTIPSYCVYNKCRIMWDIVRAKKCNVDYDKDEVLRMLRDIKETYLKHGNFIAAFNIGLDICDEACGQKKYKEMWELTQLAIEEIQQISGHPDTIPAFIRIACYAYNVGKLDVSRKYMEMYEKTGINILQYPGWIQNYYGIKQELDKTDNL